MSMIKELLRDYDNFSMYLLIDIVNYFYYCNINLTLFILDLDLIECDMDNCLRILFLSEFSSGAPFLYKTSLYAGLFL